MSLLQMSISGAILAVAITVIRAIFIHKLPKKTFLILWGIVILRLLIPISIPSVFSIYSWLLKPNAAILNTPATLITNNILTNKDINTDIKTNIVNIPSVNKPLFMISLWTVIWASGFLLCFLYFLIAYLRGINKFKISTAVENDFIKNWKILHPLKRKLSIRKSEQISAPISYGLFKSVILLPENLDLGNSNLLEYILTHEYIHIRHFHLLYKSVLILCACIHWFNPMVWIMFILLNRDIELACDESVICILGTDKKSAYAYALIDMEVHKNKAIPLCNYFNKNATQERIIAIMKNKKSSVFIIIAAFMLITGVFSIFVTSPKKNVKPLKATGTDISDKDFNKLLALKFDKYEDMSIFEYQNKVWKITDTKEYQDLLEYIDGDNDLYAVKDSDDLAYFLFNILEPLTSEKWREYTFNSYAQSDYSKASDNALLEYSFKMNIKDPNALKVKEYDTARLAVIDNFNKLMADKDEDQLKNSDFMNTAIKTTIEKLQNTYNSEKLEITLDYSYRTLSMANEGGFKKAAYSKTNNSSQSIKKEYEALLALKTPDYQELSVADFNMKLLDFANDNNDFIEQLETSHSQTDSADFLSKEEKNFINFTVWASNMEYVKFVKSQYTSKPEEDPIATIELGDKGKENKSAKWCSGSYQLSYHIKDKNILSIKDRDYRLNKVISQIQEFWGKADIESLIQMDKNNIEESFAEIAKANSNEEITFNIVKGQVYFDYNNDKLYLQ